MSIKKQKALETTLRKLIAALSVDGVIDSRLIKRGAALTACRCQGAR